MFCPVALVNARHDRAAIKLNMINPETGNRIKMVTQDSETGKPLERGKLSERYEYSKGRYLILTKEDFESVKVESSAVMKVEKFVDAGSIDPVYYDASYYLLPEGKAGEDVYAVLREAITKTNKVALSRVVISQRERIIALRPMGSGLMAHTLHEDRDLNSADQFFDEASRLNSDPEIIELAMQLIQRQPGTYDSADFEDRYETRLREMIDAKLAGAELTPEADEPADRGNVIDLVAALRKSLGQAPMSEGAAKTKKAVKGPAANAPSQPAATKTLRKRA